MVEGDAAGDERRRGGAQPWLQAWVFAWVAVLLVGMAASYAMVRPAPGWDAAAAPELRIEVNQADAATLQLLSGVGPVLADRIVAARAERPFTNAEDLQRVSGIGPTIAARIEPWVVFKTQADGVAEP